MAISTQECYLKIFISRKWIYPVAKQTENNKLTNLTININSQHIQHDEVAIWNQSAISMRRFFTARRFAGAIYAVVMCPSVCSSVTSRYCIETTGRIELGFEMEASFHLSYSVFYGRSGISKYNDTYFWNFVPNFRLLKSSPRQQQNSLIVKPVDRAGLTPSGAPDQKIWGP